MNKVIPSNATEIIQQSGAGALPDNPSQSGYNAKQIKNAIARPSILLSQWLASLEDKVDFDPASAHVVTSLPSDLTNYEENTVFLLLNDSDCAFYVYDGETASKVGYSLLEYVSHIATLEGYFTDGKANMAIADKNGNDISSTYVSLDGTQTITGEKTFSKTASFPKGIDVSERLLLLGGGLNAYSKSVLKVTIGPASDSLTYYVWPYDYANGNIHKGATYTIATTEHIATAKQEAIASAATTSQNKVDALATAMDFSNGAFGTIVAALLQVTKMEVTETETKSAKLEDQFLEMLAGNTVAYGSNYVGTVYTKYDATNDFFLGIYNKTLMLGDATASRANGKVSGITDISLQPVMTRADSSALANGHLLKWDAANNRAIDAGVTDTEINTVLTQESGRVLAEEDRVSAEQARVLAETNRALQEKYRVINHPYAITQAEYNTLMNGGVFGVHLSTPLIEGDDPELIYTVYASEALAEEAEETYIFPIQDNIEYPAKNIGGDSPYLDIPAPPETNGNYVLKCSVLNGVVTYSWEAEQ